MVAAKARPAKARDVLVIGGGVFGLWAARACLARGLSVTLAERDRIGAGASGGLVGALAPHIAERWNEKKEFQLRALLALPDLIARLEAETGLATGYARPGRAVPLHSPAQRARAEARAEAATRRWAGAGRMDLLGPDAFPGWAEPPAEGFAVDDLSAHLDPAAYCRALAASLAGRVAVLEGWRLTGWRAGVATFDKGEVAAGATILAAGWETFALLAPFLGQAPGDGVKGQALLLDAAAPPGAPMLYDDGVYVVPQARSVAVGSTSETDWRDPCATDARLDALRDKAARLCPPLSGAPVLARWAGVRPRAREREPMLGPVPGHPGLFVATGGFKIGFGVAHAAAEIVAASVLGEPVPERFSVARHLGL